jgi:hypothetical protein
MITFAPVLKTLPQCRIPGRSRKAVAVPGKGPHLQRRGYDFTYALPLVLFTTVTFALSGGIPPWVRMWLLAFALFAGFKWWTWRQVVARDLRARGEVSNATTIGYAAANEPRARRSRATQNPLVPKLRLGTPLDPRETPFRANLRPLAFLLLWPGMSVSTFLNTTTHPPKPTARQWTWAAAKTLFGATLLWIIARLFLPTQNNSVHSVIPSLPHNELLAGWIAMIGFIFLLHFGLFALLALFWQSRGIDAPPLMKCPIAASSLHDFWGRRWNAGFRDIVFALFFFPLARRCGATMAALLTFVISGLIHELVITVPAGAGYGLPTVYFTLQGVGLMFERTPLGAAFTRDWRGRIFAIAVVVLPIFALFPPAFVLRVMVPFFHFLHAL